MVSIEINLEKENSHVHIHTVTSDISQMFS